MGYPRLLKIILVLVVGVASAGASARDLNQKQANAIIPEGEYLVKSGRHVHSLSSRRYAAYGSKKKKAPKSYSARQPTRPSRAVRRPASQSSQSKKKSTKHGSKHSRPSPKSASKSSKSSKSSKRHAGKAPSRKPERRHAAKKRPHRFPVARETPNERDMPFVSIPHRRVGKADRTIVMDDPAIKAPLPKPRRVSAAIKPDGGMLDPESEGPPTSVGDAKAAVAPTVPITGPAPASVVESPPAAPAPIVAPPTAAETATREPDAFDLHSGTDPMRGP